MGEASPPERYLYHCFPRRHAGADAEIKGLRILESIVRFGLVLTPERFEVSEFLADGTRRAPIQVFQKRISFTELSPGELKGHSEKFGSFALEFEIKQARRLGAMPVWYVPPPADENDIRGLGAAIQNRLYEVSEILRRLVKLEQTVAGSLDPNEVLSITNEKDQRATSTRLTVGGAADLLYYLRLELQRPELILNTLNAMAGLLYPTENLRYTDLLDYYRQREWRILASMTEKGSALDKAMKDELKSQLLEIDGQFWSKRLTFPTGEHAIVDQSKVLREVDDRHVLSFARRVLVPGRRALRRAEKLLRQEGLKTAVEVLSTRRMTCYRSGLH